jgi:hypothetical protein
MAGRTSLLQPGLDAEASGARRPHPGYANASAIGTGSLRIWGGYTQIPSREACSPGSANQSTPLDKTHTLLALPTARHRLNLGFYRDHSNHRFAKIPGQSVPQRRRLARPKRSAVQLGAPDLVQTPSVSGTLWVSWLRAPALGLGSGFSTQSCWRQVCTFALPPQSWYNRLAGGKRRHGRVLLSRQPCPGALLSKLQHRLQAWARRAYAPATAPGGGQGIGTWKGREN